ncbi:MAG: hypothetical protein KJP07_23255 [Desulfatitalea sp.]|nr:hypothetical protein [Desulfatitalea sp.]
MSRLIPAHTHGYIDLNNSTATPLGAGLTFTGEWLDITEFGVAYINIYADVASATDGLAVQQSSDAVNPDHDDIYSISAGSAKNFAVNPHSQYMRIVYTNGANPQTAFRLQLKLNSYGLASSHRVKDDLTTDDDARLVKSIMMTKANDQQDYKNVGIHYPVPVGGDQLYPADVNVTYSDGYTFVGDITSLLNNRWSPIVDSTSNNPKELLYEFERPMQTSIMGLVTESGSFSNTVIKYSISTSAWITLLDESADSTAKDFLLTPSTPITFNRLKFEFHTANTVTLTGFNLGKSKQVIAQIQGLNDDGELVSVGATTGGNLRISLQEYGDTPAIDAFDRLRISSPFTIFDSKPIYDKQSLFFSESLGGSATSVHSTIHCRVRMTVTASASDYAIRQTKQRFNYQPGKSTLILFTFFATQQTGVTKRMGYFDGTGATFMTPNNGIFFSVSGSTLSWNIAKNGTTTQTVTQANWNFDPLDGTGPSRVTLDTDAVLIGLADIEYLGVGRVRVGFVVDGLIRYCHYFNHANYPTYTSVYMSTPNLPIRYDIQSDGTGGGSSDQICTTVISEGGVELTGVSRSIDTQNVHLNANAADQAYVLLALRLKTTHLDLTVLPQSMSMISETNDDFKWALLLNPTYAGALTYADITNSGCQRAAGATANTISAEGTKIASGYAKTTGSIEAEIVSNLRIGSTIAGVRDELVLSVTPLASNADIQGALLFRELL